MNRTKLTHSVLCAVVSATLLAPVTTAQATDTKPAPAFEVADVHPSQHSNSPQFSRSGVAHERLILRQATMTNLIGFAYTANSPNVIGGPAWMDLDRFDVIAKTPNTTSFDTARLMVRTLLADRFHLVVKQGDAMMPAYILTAPKPKLKAAADPTAPAYCQYKPQSNAPETPNPDIAFTCHNVTMKYLAGALRDLAQPYVRSPGVDQTGLTGAYDFDIHWTYQPPKGDETGTTLFDALDKLGLKLAPGSAPLPVYTVESVSETPTPNVDGIDKLLPPLPPMTFDVATVRPSPPDAKGLNLQLRGTEIVISNATLDFLLTWSWDVESRRLVSPPDFLTKDHWDIVGKFTNDEPGTTLGQPPQISMEDAQSMIKTLLADRFGLKIHTEDKPVDAWTLIADTPHMKATADTTLRTGCKTGPGPDGKDPRIANPMLARLLYCQNINMTQFANQLQTMVTGYIKDPVVDETGIKGSYDFLLSFSTAGQLRSSPPTAKPDDASSAGGAVAEAPTGGISFFDALPKEMGVKLVKTKHLEPMYIIDHIDEKPTDN
jgi:uncharacterized protein (TIGR03435 family)